MPTQAGLSPLTQEPDFTVLPWIRASLAEWRGKIPGSLDVENSRHEGVLPWLGYGLKQSGRRQELNLEAQDAVRQSLRQLNLMHLDCEAELERLAASATDAGIRFLIFKGHAAARTVYPHPACRVTSDLDFLVDPQQLGRVHTWLTHSGYEPTDPYVGTLWLGAQNWARESSGVVRFHADVHWDLTSRMYFRGRLAFEDLWAESTQIPCDSRCLRVPGTADNFIIACVHLAALAAGMPVRLIWLLDIYLMMRATDPADVGFLLERAANTHAVEACSVFGEMAARLGDRSAVMHVLDPLRERASRRRWKSYRRTLNNRVIDLAVYWARLSVADKVRIFGDMARWIRAR